MRMGFVTVAAVVFAAASGASAATPVSYHGKLLVDYRYTSGGAIKPNGPADIEQTAHLTFTITANRIVHMHGVVGFDWKERFSGCPTFTVETTGGGTVDAAPQFGIDPMFFPEWTSKTRYKTPEPSAPPAKVTSTSTTADNSCNAIHQTDKTNFQLQYLTALAGSAPVDAKKVTGSEIRNLSGYHACHPFYPLPPPPPVGVSCSWHYRWTFMR